MQKNSKYIQIAEEIKSAISSGRYIEGQRLPSERKLSAEFGVTRVTVRKAIGQLVSSGLVENRQGSGNYVAVRERKACCLKAAELPANSPPAKGRIIRLEMAVVPDISSLLKIPASAKIFLGCRLQLFHNSPVVMERFFLPVSPVMESGSNLNINDLTAFECLLREYRAKAVHNEQSIEAAAAREDEAEYLGIQADTPLLLERKLSFNQPGQPIEYSKNLYPGGRFRFMISSGRQ
ncbi:MAG: hypothetical protein CSB24_01060 [Deltaproteobacteria bacterium]|nr:MAG: hypothetical protein CSB24_01060 [Deltaproteobacteria bacterium]